jgi:hypothetical protein
MDDEEPTKKTRAAAIFPLRNANACRVGHALSEKLHDAPFLTPSDL